MKSNKLKLKLVSSGLLLCASLLTTNIVSANERESQFMSIENGDEIDIQPEKDVLISVEEGQGPKFENMPSNLENNQIDSLNANVEISTVSPEELDQLIKTQVPEENIQVDKAEEEIFDISKTLALPQGSQLQEKEESDILEIALEGEKNHLVNLEIAPEEDIDFEIDQDKSDIEFTVLSDYESDQSPVELTKQVLDLYPKILELSRIPNSTYQANINDAYGNEFKNSVENDSDPNKVLDSFLNFANYGLLSDGEGGYLNDLSNIDQAIALIKNDYEQQLEYFREQFLEELKQAPEVVQKKIENKIKSEKSLTRLRENWSTRIPIETNQIKRDEFNDEVAKAIHLITTLPYLEQRTRFIEALQQASSDEEIKNILTHAQREAEMFKKVLDYREQVKNELSSYKHLTSQEKEKYQELIDETYLGKDFDALKEEISKKNYSNLQGKGNELKKDILSTLHQIDQLPELPVEKGLYKLQKEIWDESRPTLKAQLNRLDQNRVDSRLTLNDLQYNVDQLEFYMYHALIELALREAESIDNELKHSDISNLVKDLSELGSSYASSEGDTLKYIYLNDVKDKLDKIKTIAKEIQEARKQAGREEMDSDTEVKEEETLPNNNSSSSREIIKKEEQRSKDMTPKEPQKESEDKLEKDEMLAPNPEIEDNKSNQAEKNEEPELPNPEVEGTHPSNPEIEEEIVQPKPEVEPDLDSTPKMNEEGSDKVLVHAPEMEEAQPSRPEIEVEIDLPNPEVEPDLNSTPKTAEESTDKVLVPTPEVEGITPSHPEVEEEIVLPNPEVEPDLNSTQKMNEEKSDRVLAPSPDLVPDRVFIPKPETEENKVGPSETVEEILLPELEIEPEFQKINDKNHMEKQKKKTPISEHRADKTDENQSSKSDKEKQSVVTPKEVAPKIKEKPEYISSEKINPNTKEIDSTTKNMMHDKAQSHLSKTNQKSDKQIKDMLKDEHNRMVEKEKSTIANNRAPKVKESSNELRESNGMNKITKPQKDMSQATSKEKTETNGKNMVKSGDKKETKALPITGDETSRRTVFGVMMAALSGIFFTKRKNRMKEK